MKSKPVCLLVLSGVPLLLSCLSNLPVSELGTQSLDDQAIGSFSVSSQTVGNQTFVPSVCTAGDRQFFLGCDLKSRNSSLVVRLVVDPLEGPAVRLFSSEAPFDKSVVFHRSDCSVFHFSLDGTGWRVNDVNDYRFTLQLECSRPGESISGSASSTHCH